MVITSEPVYVYYTYHLRSDRLPRLQSEIHEFNPGLASEFCKLRADYIWLLLAWCMAMSPILEITKRVYVGKAAGAKF